jgi:hypothetical protein
MTAQLLRIALRWHCCCSFLAVVRPPGHLDGIRLALPRSSPPVLPSENRLIPPAIACLPLTSSYPRPGRHCAASYEQQQPAPITFHAEYSRQISMPMLSLMPISKPYITGYADRDTNAKCRCRAMPCRRHHRRRRLSLRLHHSVYVVLYEKQHQPVDLP